MPIPKREKGEEAQKFMGRCMTSETMQQEYPEQKQRVAVCTAQSRAAADKLNFAEMFGDEFVYAEYEKDCECGEVEELTESNFVVPEESDYEDFGEEVEEVSADGLWDNIRKKKEREGKNYKPAKKGDKDRPDPKAWKKAQQAKGESVDLLVKPGEDYVIKQDVKEYLRGLLIAINEDSSYEIAYWYDKLEPYPIEVIIDGKSIAKDAKTIKLNFHPEIDKADALQKDELVRYELNFAAKYQGRTVTLNKPFRTPGGPKKRSVYVKNQKGNVVKVNFGDPNMKIKKSDPGRRKNFRARHRCDTPGPKWKARYWSCKAW